MMAGFGDNLQTDGIALYPKPRRISKIVWKDPPFNITKPHGWHAAGGVWFCDTYHDYDHLVTEDTVREDNHVFRARLYFGPKGGLLPLGPETDTHVCPDCGVTIKDFEHVDDFLDEHVWHSSGQCSRLKAILGVSSLAKYLELMRDLKTTPRWVAGGSRVGDARDREARLSYNRYAKPRNSDNVNHSLF